MNLAYYKTPVSSDLYLILDSQLILISDLLTMLNLKFSSYHLYYKNSSMLLLYQKP